MRICCKPFLIAFAVILLCACTRQNIPDPGNRPAHHTKTGFKNLYIEDAKKGFFSFLKMKYFSDVEWADPSIDASKIPLQQVDLEKIHHPAEAQITWLGHSSFLIQKDSINILTDPVFSDRTSPFSFMGPQRYVAHVIDYAHLPAIHHVVISHDHYDHLDKKAIKQLAHQADFHVPLKLKEWFVDLGVAEHNIHEYDWWQSQDLSGISFQAQPSQHWSGRWLHDSFDRLWASWLIKITDYTIWFAGDTGYNDRLFKEIGAGMSPPNLALIPIGAYAPRFFMKDYHVNPEEAVQIHRDVNAKYSIGMHWGTFPLTAEPPLEPLQKLQQAVQKNRLRDQEFKSMIMGATVALP